jgi:hypothetical protein
MSVGAVKGKEISAGVSPRAPWGGQQAAPTREDERPLQGEGPQEDAETSEAQKGQR